ncbi:hypothetical protein BGX38DRAFT_1208310 [Terfezia claveryi]|nr:hypothetical protein BGX38DRAFT_1208310 [Terfezia claveryi]
MPSLTLILILPFSLTTNHTRIPRLHHLTTTTTTTTTHYLCFNFHICRYKSLNLQISPHGHISLKKNLKKTSYSGSLFPFSLFPLPSSLFPFPFSLSFLALQTLLPTRVSLQKVK